MAIDYKNSFSYKIKLYSSFILNILSTLFLAFVTPLGIYVLLVDKVGFSHIGAVVYSLYFSICLYILSVLYGLFTETLPFECFKKEFDIEYRAKRKL